MKVDLNAIEVINEENSNAIQNLHHNQSRWLTVEETAAYLKVSERTIYNYLKQGIISSKRWRKTIRIDKLGLDEPHFD